MKKGMHFAIAFTLAIPAACALASDPHAGHAAHAASAHKGAMSEGEIKRIDNQAGKVTIKHGPLANLGMPPMTMTFGVKDAAQLEGFKTGDKIRFVAEKNGGRYQAAQLERAQ
jgi:Cu(I)/Ag(I) efflux system periplasmic protein CusF